MKGILVFAPWAAGGFEDTELGAFGAALDWNPAIARAFSLLRPS